jgi:hypothetical protein
MFHSKVKDFKNESNGTLSFANFNWITKIYFRSLNPPASAARRQTFSWFSMAKKFCVKKIDWFILFFRNKQGK